MPVVGLDGRGAYPFEWASLRFTVTVHLDSANCYELVKSGALPSVRLDGCRRIKADDLRRFVDGLPSEAA